MAVSIAGVISIVVFYLVILVIGLIAARKSGFRARNIDSQDVILAGRNIGLFVGVFTMTGRYNFPLLSLIFGYERLLSMMLTSPTKIYCCLRALPPITFIFIS